MFNLRRAIKADHTLNSFPPLIFDADGLGRSDPNGGLQRRGDPPRGPYMPSIAPLGTAFGPAQPTCYFHRSYQSPDKLLHRVGPPRIGRAVGQGQAVTGRKIVSPGVNSRGLNRGPHFYRAVARGRDVWRSADRASHLPPTLAGRGYFNAKRDPPTFFEKSRI